MRRIAIALLAAGAGAFGVAQATAAPTCTTTASASGAWSSAGTWTNGIPGAGVDACVAAGVTVTVASETMAGPGTTTVLAGGKLTVTGYPTLSDGRVLANEGTIELTGTDRWISAAGAAPLLRNTGTIRSTQDFTIYAPLENDGLVIADAGVLALRAGAGESSGDFGGGSGLVDVSSGTHVLAGGADLLGAVRLSGGELSVADGSVSSTGANEISGGILSGSGGLTVASGTLTWSGGTMKGPGTTTVVAGAKLVNPGYTTLSDGRVLANAGTVELTGTGRWINVAGAAPALRNTGTIRSTQDFTVYAPVENDGTVVSDAGALDLRAGTGESGGGYGGGAGTVRISAGTHVLAGGADLLGGVDVAGGEVSVATGGTASSTGANAITGGIVAGPGALSVDAGTLTWSGGTMKGPGTTTITSGAKLANPGYTTLSEGRVLANAGTLDLSGAGRWINRAGAAPVLRNTGTIRSSAAFTIYPAIENDGSISSDAGQLDLAGGGSDGSAGTFGGGAGTVRIAGGGWQLDDGAAIRSGVTLASTTVTIPAGTVTATGTTAMTSGTVDGAGTLSIPSGTFSWSGGTMTGSGTTGVASGATLALPGTGSVSLGGTRTLDVAGLANFTADGGMGTAGAGAAPLLHVAAGGVLRKSGGANWSYVTVPVRNDGTADGQAGQLMLTRGAAQPHTGTFKGTSATETVVLSGQGHVLTAAARLGDFAEIDGEVAVRDGDTLTIADHVLQTGGKLSGDVTVTGTLTWSGGSHVAPGATTIAAPGTIELAGCDGGDLGAGRRLIVNGTLDVGGGSTLSGYDDENPPEIRNAGRIELDSGPGACGSSTGIFGTAVVANLPAGTIEKLGGAGPSYLGNLDNDGLVLDSAAGDLHVDANSALTQTGTFRSTGAGAIDFEYGTFMIEPGAAIEGDTSISGADVHLADGTTLAVAAGDTLTHEGGSILGPGDVEVAGTLDWTGGYQEGSGATILEPGATATVSPAAGEDTAYAALGASRSLVNRGTLTVEDAYLEVRDGASVLNRGTMELRGDSVLEGYGYGEGFASVLHNTGLLRSGAGAIDASVPVDNDGTIEVGTGSLELSSLVNWAGIGFLGETGIAGGEYVVRGTLVVPGDVTVNAARLVLDGAGSKVVRRTFAGAQADALGTLERNAGGGELVLRGGRSLTLAGALANQGVLELGAGSTLTAKGFRQSAGAILRPAVTAGGVGRVTSTAPAQLGGRLDTPVAPALSGTRTVLSATALGGGFSSVTGGYAAEQTATEVRLKPPAGSLRRAPVTGIAPAPAPAADGGGTAAPAPAAGPGPLSTAGPWRRRGALLSGSRRGARVVVRGVRGRELALVARTCRRCGPVRVRWAGRTRTVSLRGRPGRRTIRVLALARERAGTVRITAVSGRRVAVRALLVR